jgi:hypothetical protein
MIYGQLGLRQINGNVQQSQQNQALFELVKGKAMSLNTPKINQILTIQAHDLRQLWVDNCARAVVGLSMRRLFRWFQGEEILRLT